MTFLTFIAGFWEEVAVEVEEVEEQFLFGFWQLSSLLHMKKKQSEKERLPAKPKIISDLP